MRLKNDDALVKQTKEWSEKGKVMGRKTPKQYTARMTVLGGFGQPDATEAIL